MYTKAVVRTSNAFHLHNSALVVGALAKLEAPPSQSATEHVANPNIQTYTHSPTQPLTELHCKLVTRRRDAHVFTNCLEIKPKMCLCMFAMQHARPPFASWHTLLATGVNIIASAACACDRFGVTNGNQPASQPVMNCDLVFAII